MTTSTKESGEKLYLPRKGSMLSKEQAQRYGPSIQAIADSNDGEVTALQVLEDASGKRSPLHDFFQWDDTEAARQYRLTQARLMIRSVDIVYVDSRGNESKQAKAFPSVAYQDDRTEENRVRHHYLTAQRVFDDEDTRQEIIDGFRRRINSLRRDMRQVEGMDSACRILGIADEELGTAS